MKANIKVALCVLENNHVLFHLIKQKLRDDNMRAFSSIFSDDKVVFHAFKITLSEIKCYNYFKSTGIEYLENFKKRHFIKNILNKRIFKNNFHINIESLSDRQKNICNEFIKKSNIAMNIKLSKYYNYLKMNAFKTFNFLNSNGDFDLFFKSK